MVLDFAMAFRVRKLSGPAIERRSPHSNECFRTSNIVILLTVVCLYCLRVVANPSTLLATRHGSVVLYMYVVCLTLSSSRASSLTAGFTVTGPPTKLSVGVLHRVSPAGDVGLLSNCKCDGTAVNGGSSGLSSTLETSSESTTRMKANQGMGWYKRQLDVTLLGQTFKFSILAAFPRF